MAGRSDEVIVLDDEASYAEMLTCLLREEGFNTRMFVSPQEALKYLRSHTCSVVVADYKMPELSGSEFLQKVRENNPGLPVIVISGHMNTRDLLSVANIGVTLVLEKPFEKAALIEHVSRFATPDASSNSSHVKAGANGAHVDAGSSKGEEAASSENKYGVYPAQNMRCAQASDSSRKFLQELWEAVNEHGGANLALPLGGELELLITDIERWFGLDSPALRLSPTMMKVDRGDFAQSKVLAMLDARYASSDMGEDIAALKKKLPEGMPLLVVRRSDNARADGGLPLVVLPPLSVRLEDVATYSRAILERMDSADLLTDDAKRLLLNYPWPGNYYELMGALRRAVLNGDGAQIDSVMLAAAVADGHGVTAVDSSIMTLERYLAGRQSEWFGEQGCEDHDSAEKAAELPRSSLYRELPLYKQPLQFPELLDQ